MVAVRVNPVLSLKGLDQRRAQLRSYLLRPEGLRRLEGAAPFYGLATKELLGQRALIHLGLHACGVEHRGKQGYDEQQNVSSRFHHALPADYHAA